jgi:hypothetical protein
LILSSRDGGVLKRRSRTDCLNTYRAIGGFTECRGNLMQQTSLNSVVSPVAPLFSRHQLCFSQDLQVLRYGRLRNLKPACESPDAKIVGQEKIYDSEPGFVRKSFENCGNIFHTNIYLSKY